MGYQANKVTWTKRQVVAAALLFAVVFTFGPARTASAEVSAETMVDVLRRLDYLEKKSRELQGENEVLGNELRKLKQLQKQGFLHVDERIDSLNIQLQGVKKIALGQSGNTDNAGNKDTATPSNSAARPSSDVGSAANADRVVSAVTTEKDKPVDKPASQTVNNPDTSRDDNPAGKSGSEAAETTVENPAEPKASQKATPVDSITSASDSAGLEKTDDTASTTGSRAPTKYEKETYQAAYDKIKQSPTAATLAFEEYIKMQPDSPLAANARYWIGEIKYSHNNYKGAIEDFIKVLQEHKYSNKAPDAAVKLGYSFYALKNWAYARRTFEDVLKYFPENENAVNLAKNRLSQLDAAGH